MAWINSRLIFGALIAMLLGGVWCMMFDITVPAWGVWAWLAVTLGLTLWLWQAVVATMSRTVTGLNLLIAQDNSSTLARTGNTEADKVVNLFNSLMLSLKEQRLYNEEQKHFFNLLLEVIPIGMAVCDFDGHITNANPALLHYLGLGKNDSLAGLTLADLPGEAGQRIAALPPEEKQATFRTSDGIVWQFSRLHFMEKGFSRTFILLEKVTAVVWQAERDTYRRLIRTIAHEVNNTMAGVLPLMDVVAASTDDAELVHTTDAIAGCCRDMSELITRLANVVKIPVPTPVQVDMRQFISDCMPFLESLSAGRVKVEAKLPDGACTVMADPLLLQPCMVNIVKNAVESVLLADRKNGLVTVELDERARRLSVTDNGRGVSPEIADKIFSPFFSDKPGGNGIGLMFVAEVLRLHDFGYRLFTSPYDNLTRFEITF